MDLWQELFGTIGWWVLPFMVAVWAFREWWEARKHRDQEKMTRLAEARAERIQAFYSMLRRTQGLLTDLSYVYRPVGVDPPEVDLHAAIQQMRELESTAKEQQIYFSEDLSATIQNLCEALSEAVRALENREILIQSHGHGTEEQDEVEQEAFRILQTVVPELMDTLDREFRHLLGSA